MAKTKRSKAVVKRKPKMRVVVPRGLDSYGAAHAKMLYDPCSSILQESVYPGDRGYVNRFNATSTYGGSALATGFLALWKPGNACSSNFDFASTATAFTIAYQRPSYPGATFIAANCSKTRAIAFCIALAPNTSPNLSTGTIHFGMVNASAVPNAGIVSADTLVQLCTERVSAAQALLAPLEIKWSPGGFDDRYSGNVVTDDDSDRNVLVVVATGLPPATGVTYRCTAIMEWSPGVNLGISNDATSVGRSTNNIADVTRVLKQKDNNWWWALGNKTLGLAESAVRGFAKGGALGALSGAISYL